MAGTRLRNHCLYVVVVSLCLMPILISARANLDISEPIVKRSPAADEDSFGFAVTLHQVEVPVERNIDSFLDRTRYVTGCALKWVSTYGWVDS